ncbi:MGH1-like glycoside hydrolase domain-containing protein [Terriglobus tenax]|uniref:MGH1-like glycoside hydrolase domain-containing protein n=1 Tax=Terriglobus tenax TaxID=1111115 RepID=UPI0021E07DA0|nr:glucosidase [Terriglobus tenax]
MDPLTRTAEDDRLDENKARTRNWQRWGTYLPERQWGTVREDYSYNGDVWNSFPYEMGQYRAYRWGEDGLLGWTDRQCRLCFSPVLWNGQDATLKERLFGLGNPEGNHGEDVKEQFYYLDATPTHSYCKGLYKYPQSAFPYQQLREENRRRGYNDPEYELIDTGIFDESRYFDVFVEYAKAGDEDTLIRLTAWNRGPDAAPLTLLPQLTLRNNWSWKNLEETGNTRPYLRQTADFRVHAHHKVLGNYAFYPLEDDALQPERLVFTENDSNFRRLDPNFQGDDHFSKDGFDRLIVHGEENAVKAGEGTRCALVYRWQIPPGESCSVLLRLVRLEDESSTEPASSYSLQQAEEIFATRLKEADEFYAQRIPAEATPQECLVARQAYAGLLWSKQFYYFIAEQWMSGDKTQIAPPPERAKKSEPWKHLFCRDVLSMPDKWEYPWFAAWDTAFHMIPMARIDAEFAKNQLLLLLREWYMHPNGQIPAYEFSFSDVNPPVHGWAVWHVYRLGVDENGVGDLDFLERAFQKLMLNFTWWVNRNDEKGRNLFGGGFLGLDNIGVFDRSVPLPDGVSLHQADGTAWMGLYCSVMLQIAMELAHHRSKAYEDIASKFFEHYIAVIDAINTVGGSGLWDEEDGFYFDHLEGLNGENLTLKVRSMVGIAPLFAVCILKKDTVEDLPDFYKRTDWFLNYNRKLSAYVSTATTHHPDLHGSRWIAIAPQDRFRRILQRVLDESEFLSGNGVRALSRYHHDHPFETELNGQRFSVRYTPAEGDSGMFGGNSNWRGPVWFPMNMLFINALERYSLVYGDDLKLEYPTGSGEQHTLVEIAEDIARRLVNLFLPGPDGRRPCQASEARFANDPYWKDLMLFYEYFDGDTGRGVGASHQTGWTALAASLIEGLYTRREIRNRAQ